MNPKLKGVLPMLLLAVLTVVFFLGGVYLDSDAASHGVKGVLRNAPNATPEQIKDALAFQSERIKSIHQDAAAAYDIAKVSLGALVSTIAQLVSANGRQQSQGVVT